jgi:hypothetical protein
MIFRMLILCLVSLSTAQLRYIGPASKTFSVDSVRVGVSKAFADTLLFQDGADTLAAPYSGLFRVITPAVHDTLIQVAHDTLRVPFVVYVHDTSTVYQTVYVDSTLRPPVVNRWALGLDTILEVRLDSCSYILHAGRLTRKYSCK